MKLNLPEKLFVLSIDDNDNTIKNTVSNTLCCGLVGALLAELALNNRIQIKDNYISESNLLLKGEILSDEIQIIIDKQLKPFKVSDCINSIATSQVIKHMAEHLVKLNIIGIIEKHYLWIIPYKVYPQRDKALKHSVKQHLRNIVTADEKAEPEDYILLSLLKSCQLLSLVFTYNELKTISTRIDTLVENEVFGLAVRKSLLEIDIAAVAIAASAAS